MRRGLALPREESDRRFKRAGDRLRVEWRSLLVEALLLAALVIVLNVVFLSVFDGPKGDALAVFFKNLTVIPLVIVFQVLVAVRLLGEQPSEAAN